MGRISKVTQLPQPPITGNKELDEFNKTLVKDIATKFREVIAFYERMELSPSHRIYFGSTNYVRVENDHIYFYNGVSEVQLD